MFKGVGMKIEEANKIIAEYMGWKYDGIFDDDLMWCPESGYREAVRFKDSLDALVPVWEKIKCTQIKLGDSYGFEQCVVRYKFDEWVWSEGKSIQHAACIATAKAVKELK